MARSHLLTIEDDTRYRLEAMVMECDGKSRGNPVQIIIEALDKGVFPQGAEAPVTDPATRTTTVKSIWWSVKRAKNRRFAGHVRKSSFVARGPDYGSSEALTSRPALGGCGVVREYRPPEVDSDQQGLRRQVEVLSGPRGRRSSSKD
jgi:hypothetical protein